VPFGVLDGDRVVIIAQVNSPPRQRLLREGWWHWRPHAFDYGTGDLGASDPEISSRPIELWCKHNGMRPPRDLGQPLDQD